MQVDERCEKAIEILQKTNDGDDLSPGDLYLVECAVNGFVNENGEKAFDRLLESVRSGYKPPWFHGIPNLLRDQTGYIRWKGTIVEHYDSPWCYSKEGKAAALEVARRCRILEAFDEEISCHNVIWAWPEK